MSLPSRQIGGHKAAMNNPRVSDEAKEHSRQAIDDLEANHETEQTRQGHQNSGSEGKDPVRVNAGYKATLKNPNVGQDAKDHAQEVLEERDAL